MIELGTSRNRCGCAMSLFCWIEINPVWAVFCWYPLLRPKPLNPCGQAPCFPFVVFNFSLGFFFDIFLSVRPYLDSAYDHFVFQSNYHTEPASSCAHLSMLFGNDNHLAFGCVLLYTMCHLSTLIDWCLLDPFIHHIFITLSLDHVISVSYCQCYENLNQFLLV